MFNKRIAEMEKHLETIDIMVATGGIYLHV
jgi:hypothetical protein